MVQAITRTKTGTITVDDHGDEGDDHHDDDHHHDAGDEGGHDEHEAAHGRESVSDHGHESDPQHRRNPVLRTHAMPAATHRDMMAGATTMLMPTAAAARVVQPMPMPGGMPMPGPVPMPGPHDTRA